jgi:hypothetical protein
MSDGTHISHITERQDASATLGARNENHFCTGPLWEVHPFFHVFLHSFVQCFQGLHFHISTTKDEIKTGHQERYNGVDFLPRS